MADLVDTTSPTLGLACVAAAGAARRDREAFTVFSFERAGELRYHIIRSQEYAVLRENNAHHGWTALASFLPGGTIEVYPAGKDHPYFSTAGA